MSLEALWKSIKTRLGESVWQYIPNGNRKLVTNGKAYVKKALALLSELGLYRQTWIKYSALLDEALEVYLVLDASDISVLSSVLQSIQSSCLMMEAYQGTEEKYLLKMIGNHHLIYRLMNLSLSSGSGWYFLDKTKSLQCRFKYELLFKVKDLSWAMPSPMIAKEVKA